MQQHKRYDPIDFSEMLTAVTQQLKFRWVLFVQNISCLLWQSFASSIVVLYALSYFIIRTCYNDN